jgi:Zn-dependent protease/predicted transcriptional regulator
MGKSFKILTISGIPLKLHWSFPIMLIYPFYVFRGQSFETQLTFVALILGLFLCVLLHELGHAFAARRYGVKTVDIILSPIGGVARLKQLPSNPFQELVIAAAGPLVIVVIAVIIGLVLFIKQGYLDFGYFNDMGALLRYVDWINFLMLIFFLNIFLVLFNLIPAFPMDGGRIFRALLSLKLKRERATFYAMLVGQLFSVLFVIYGFWQDDYIIPIIGIFVFLAATGEYRSVKMGELLKRFTVKDVMREPVTALQSNTPVHLANEYLLKDNSGDFLVVGADDNAFIGVITRNTLNNLLKNKEGQDSAVVNYISDKVQIVAENTDTNQLYQIMSEERLSNVVVMNELGEIQGIVDVRQMDIFIRKHLKDSRRVF